MATDIQNAFLSLVRLGIGAESTSVHSEPFNAIDWDAMQTLANEQGLTAIAVDGLEILPVNQKPPKLLLLQWIGEVLQNESVNAAQQRAAAEMALLFYHNKIRTYVLKGAIVAECYPKPEHRSSVDLDCFLLPEKNDFDAWELGNSIIQTKGYEVNTDFYKNSTFNLPCLIVESHQFLTPFRGNKTLTQLERLLQTLLRQDTDENRFEGKWLYRPPVMVSALFLIEHAYSHFLHQGLTWRYVLDWVMFSKKHHDEIKWSEFEAYIDEFNFRKFYNSFSRMGKLLMGDLTEEELTKHDKKMLTDIWTPLNLHETVSGMKGKLAFAGNTWRARWKYRYFTDMNWIQALWIQTKGVLFIKNPKLY